MIDEFNQFISATELYAESVINVIESEKALSKITDEFFTEVVKDYPDPEDVNIVGKILVAIGDIFYKLASLFTKGKVCAKARTQHAQERKIAKDVQKYGSMRVKIQDVWTYSKYIDRTIDNFTKGFNKKTVMTARKIKGDNKGIKILIKNMNTLSEYLRNPSKKKSEIIGNNNSQTKKDVANFITPIVAPGIVSAVTPFIFDIVFQDSPTTVGAEIVTVKELYNRLVSLKPDQFPSIMKEKTLKVNNWMQRQETLNYFREYEGGGRSAVKYSSELSELLTAYTLFYQGMIDYYLSVIISALNAGKSNVSANDLYQPDKIVSSNNLN